MSSATMDRIKVEMSDLNGSPSILDYEFDSADFDVPTWLRIPPQVRDALLDLEQKAMVTIASMKKLMLRRNDRFNSLCFPNNDLFDRHAQSIQHILGWKEEFHHLDPTLAVSAKIPLHALNLFVEEHAYAKLAHQYTQMVTAYLEGQFYTWRKSCNGAFQLAHRLMCNPRSLRYNNLHDFKEFSKWFNGEFASAMFEWEKCLWGLDLPTFEETILDLRVMIHDRVDENFSVSPL